MKAIFVLSLCACGGGGGAAIDGGGGGGGDGGGSGSNGSGSSQCDPGFVDAGAGCVPIDAADPAQRTSAAVCTKWAAMHVVTDAHPFATTADDCTPGTLSAGGHTDALVRINGFRWLGGLGDTTLTATLDAQQQACADMEAWWDFTSPDSPHDPPATSKCYTAAAKTGAGSSNIAWGNSPSDSIDQFVEDHGNDTTLGHRRWIMFPPLGPVGIGYWAGAGTPYGSAECLAVFNQTSGGAAPKFVAVPNPGPVPLEVAMWTWSFGSTLGGTANATAKVVRASDGRALAVTMKPLSQGYGLPTISWVPAGWTPAAGETYRVTISGVTGGDLVYAVKPVTCM